MSSKFDRSLEIVVLISIANLVSGRSSCSSLNNAPTQKPSLINNVIKRESVVQFRKVSINTDVKSVDDDVGGKNGTTSPQSTLSVTSSSQPSSNRTSLIHISAEKRAKKVRFFINSDKFFKGAVIAVSAEKFRTFEKLLEHLTRIMCNQVRSRIMAL